MIGLECIQVDGVDCRSLDTSNITQHKTKCTPHHTPQHRHGQSTDIIPYTLIIPPHTVHPHHAGVSFPLPTLLPRAFFLPLPVAKHHQLSELARSGSHLGTTSRTNPEAPPLQPSFFPPPFSHSNLSTHPSVAFHPKNHAVFQRPADWPGRLGIIPQSTPPQSPPKKGTPQPR